MPVERRINLLCTRSLLRFSFHPRPEPPKRFRRHIAPLPRLLYRQLAVFLPDLEPEDIIILTCNFFLQDPETEIVQLKRAVSLAENIVVALGEPFQDFDFPFIFIRFQQVMAFGNDFEMTDLGLCIQYGIEAVIIGGISFSDAVPQDIIENSRVGQVALSGNSLGFEGLFKDRIDPLFSEHGEQQVATTPGDARPVPEPATDTIPAQPRNDDQTKQKRNGINRIYNRNGIESHAIIGKRLKDLGAVIGKAIQ